MDVDGRKVAEIATEYGCSPANIYALLAKLRQTGTKAEKINHSAAGEGNQAGITGSPDCQATKPSLTITSSPPLDLLSAVTVVSKVAASSAAAPSGDPITIEVSRPRSPTTRATAVVSGPAGIFQPIQQPTPAVAVAAMSKGDAAPPPELPRKLTTKGNGVGSALAKPGFGLMMRTEDGDENLTPIRSLDDLLSAVKPILRTAAHSTDPVWFSIQPVDLATIDSDAG